MYSPKTLTRDEVVLKATEIVEKFVINNFVLQLEEIDEKLLIGGGFLFYSFSRSINNNYPVVVADTNNTMIISFFAGESSEITGHPFKNKEEVIQGVINYYRELLIGDRKIDGYIEHYASLDPNEWENAEEWEDNFFYGFIGPSDSYAIEFDGFNIDNIS